MSALKNKVNISSHYISLSSDTDRLFIYMEHHFDVEDAKRYGIECAILLYNIRFWIAKNKANKSNFYDGRFWTYNSAKAFSELFPYMSRPQIARHLRKLEKLGVLISDNFNTVGYDKTKWYSILDNVCTELNNPCTKMNKDSSEINKGELKNEQPIPDIKTDNKLQIEITDIRQKQKTFDKWNSEDFEEEIKNFIHIYDKKMLHDFYNYWSEKDKKGNMRFQLQKTWETSKRLTTWEKNQKQFNKPGARNFQEQQEDKIKSAAMRAIENIYNS